MKLKRKPTSPGEILREEFLLPLEMTQKQLSDHIEVDIKVINRIVNGRSAVTPMVALKLAHAFNTTPTFWLNAQNEIDLFNAEHEMTHVPKPLVGRSA